MTMTTNQTIDGVPRAALEIMLSGKGGLAQAAAAHELRALLDAPTSAEDGRWGYKNGDPETGDQGDLAWIPAAQPQGEPVAYADPKAFENFGSLAHLGGLYAREWMWANPAPGLVPLYTEQTAPVLRCSFCDVTDQAGNPWSGHHESVNGELIYRVMGCKDHKHLVDALNGCKPASVEVIRPFKDSDTVYDCRLPCCGSCPGGCTIGAKP
jgi:hypothetical protein